MKTKLVFWGSNEKEEKILVGISLRAADNKIDIYTFPEEKVTDAFHDQMMEEWRLGKEVEFPEGHQHQERDLNASESLLPDSIKAMKTDLIKRAQTEWQFVVLSEKLHKAYETELNDLQERVEKLESFDKGVWDNLKEFWDKVQGQARERNLFWEHANKLRDNVNDLFGRLKDMRSKLDEEFRNKSKDNLDQLGTALEELEERIKEGSRMRSVFNDLKKMQKAFWDAEMTREHRQKMRKRINAAFKKVKEKRFGESSANDQDALQRITRRYDGLLGAIDKMERSMERDKKDFKFQERRIEDSDGQLEAQIRQAKIKMIEERLKSKQDKLSEMHKTREQLEDRIKKIKEREERRQKTEDAKKAAKDKIAQEMQKRSPEVDSEKLEEAAEKINKTRKKKDQEEEKKKKPESLLDAVGTTLGEALEDVVDTVKAVAEVVGDRIEEKVDDFKESLKDEEE
ncbi:MAG: phage tail tape measure protein [Bacteroidetes bacterium]|nr:phage tail tape measure protein [Bacteroidota bacterium]